MKTLREKFVGGLLLCATIAAVPMIWGQSSPYVFKTDGESAIVWNNPVMDNPSPYGWSDQFSSIVTDPLTGSKLDVITYQGVSVTSSLRSMTTGPITNNRPTAYVPTFTVVNNTDFPVTVDASTFTSTLPLASPKVIKQWYGKKADPRDYEMRSGVIQPGQSGVFRALLMGVDEWSIVDGCGSVCNLLREWNGKSYFTIPVRYSIRIRGKDFVFPWRVPLQGEFAVVPQLWNP